MNLRETIAKFISPDLQSADAVKALVAEEIQRARLSMPISANYDPHGEGYRPMSGSGRLIDLAAIDLDKMREVAYYMWDTSPMLKGMASMDKAFLFAEPFTVTSDDEDVQAVIDRFLEDPENDLVNTFPDLMMWLSLLGEQCWPVTVFPQNGHVQLGYAPPDEIAEIWTLPGNRRQPVQVELRGSGGRQGRKLSVIRVDQDPRSRTYGKLVGECFFFRINNPPDSPRGRSDFLTLFDWIDGLERYGFNHLERAEFLLNFVWDVTLRGMTEEQIREWLRNNPPPKAGSQRAHNENVEWKAVSPELNAVDVNTAFDMAKAFIMGSARRPASWYGEGGKAYQTEAEQFGQVPIKDLDQRQQMYKGILTQVIRFALDQAVIAGRLSEEKAAEGFTVNMPEISKRDFTRLMNGIPQAAAALQTAEIQGWVDNAQAAQVFASIIGQLGVEIDVQEDAPRTTDHESRTTENGQRTQQAGSLLDAVGRFTPEQEEIEGLAEAGLTRAAALMPQLDAPIRRMIEKAGSLEELKDMLLDAYKGMDVSDMQALLVEALGVAALHGLTTGTNKK